MWQSFIDIDVETSRGSQNHPCVRLGETPQQKIQLNENIFEMVPVTERKGKGNITSRLGGSIHISQSQIKKPESK